MNEVLARLPYLSTNERLAVNKFMDNLKQEYSHAVFQVLIYGSSIRGERSPDSDIDLLIITRDDNWREHEPIRFLAARLSNEYEVFLSIRLMSLARFRNLRTIQPFFFQNIQQESLELIRLSNKPDLVKPQPQPG